jgi:hypothetical protein
MRLRTLPAHVPMRRWGTWEGVVWATARHPWCLSLMASKDRLLDSTPEIVCSLPSGYGFVSLALLRQRPLIFVTAFTSAPKPAGSRAAGLAKPYWIMSNRTAANHLVSAGDLSLIAGQVALAFWMKPGMSALHLVPTSALKLT